MIIAIVNNLNKTFINKTMKNVTTFSAILKCVQFKLCDMLSSKLKQE